MTLYIHQSQQNIVATSIEEIEGRIETMAAKKGKKKAAKKKKH